MSRGIHASWPADFHTSFTRLPRRCVFCNHCVRVVLTGLRARESVTGITPSFPITLLVTFGVIRLEARGEVSVASEGQMLMLNPGVTFRLSASAPVDFLVLGPNCPAQSAALN